MGGDNPTRAAWWILAIALILGVLLVGALLTRPARAEDRSYCVLWAREAVRLDYLHETAAITPEALEEAWLRRYLWCGNQETGQRLGLPGWKDDATQKAWAEFIAAAYRATQERADAAGTEPAGDAPEDPPADTVPAERLADEEWRRACGDIWRTFDPETGTVIRPNRRGVRVPCPLELIDGEWSLPE